jgi:hypothetical protein
MSTQGYRHRIFDKLSLKGLESFQDPEAAELHQRASDLFEEATFYDHQDELKDTHAKSLYRQAMETLSYLEEVQEMDKEHESF